jgi:DNA-binding transcriptional LysR family regulator
MQDHDWNDLRYVLALAREKSFAQAGRLLRVDPTTIARRLRRLEAALGAQLFERDVTGELRPTPSGETAVARAKLVETQLAGLAEALQGRDGAIAGTVRITAVPILINRVLIPALPSFLARHPGLRLELIAEPRDLSLNRREADIAVRLARPDQDAGNSLITRRIGTIVYAAYAAARLEDKGAALPWIGYEEGMSHLPQARWIAAAADKPAGPSPLFVNDAEGLLQAVQAGLGRSLLPRIVGDRTEGLIRLPCDTPAPTREIWLLIHPDLKHLARIAAVTAWLSEVVLDRDRDRLKS